jgi:hypothetical protein
MAKAKRKTKGRTRRVAKAARRKAKAKTEPESRTKKKTGTGTGTGTGTVRSKKKPARGAVKPPSGRAAGQPEEAATSQARVREFGAPVKHRAPQVHGPKPGKKRKLSKNPEAVRSRKRRAEARAIADALEADKARKRELAKKRRAAKKHPPKPIDLAPGWLEGIRAAAASVAPTSLEIVEPGSWMITGHFILLEPVPYAVFGELLQAILDDSFLLAHVNPQRLCAIRVVFHDPIHPRRENDSFLAKVSGIEFALGDLIGEILGGSPNDESALAVRYEESVVTGFYVSLAGDVKIYETPMPENWAFGGQGTKATPKTATVSIKKLK